MHEANYMKQPGEFSKLCEEILLGYPPDAKLVWYEKFFKRHLIYSNLLKTFDIQPRGMVYLGANTGQLLWAWLFLGFNKILMAEPQADKFPMLERQTRLARKILDARNQFSGSAGALEISAYQCAISSENGTADLHVMSNSNLTSLLEPNEMLIQEQTKNIQSRIKLCARIKVPVYTLDHLIQNLSQYPFHALNFLYMNIQGSELNALKGAPETLPHLQFILLEVNYIERYQGSPSVDAINDYLAAYGFEPVWGHRATHSGFIGYKK